MKWHEIQKEINEIMAGHENDDIFSIIIFTHRNEKFKFEKNDNRWNIRNKYKEGLLK